LTQVSPKANLLRYGAYSCFGSGVPYRGSMLEHAAVIAVLLLERPTCLDCIAMKAGLTLTEVNSYLATMTKTLDLVRQDDERCRVCGNIGHAFSLARSVN